MLAALGKFAYPLHYVLTAGITQSRIKMQRRLKEKKLLEKLDDLKLKEPSRTAKKLNILQKNLASQEVIETVISDGYRLGMRADEIAEANPDVKAALSLANGSVTEWSKLAEWRWQPSSGRARQTQATPPSRWPL